MLGTPLAKIGDRRLFTKELEEALMDGLIDLAVHSLKDLPTDLPDGLDVAAVPEREDPRDALIAPRGTTLASLGRGAKVGTSSLRRRAQLLARRPDLNLVDVRGNLKTRLSRFHKGEYDALVLAQAGLSRIGLEGEIAEVLDVDEVMPAVGQGALAVETRSGDAGVAALLSAIEHLPTRLAISAERAFLARLEGGCQAPIGALATWQGGTLCLSGRVLSLDGSESVGGSESAQVDGRDQAEALGSRLAQRLIAQGAGTILQHVRDASPSEAPAQMRGGL